MTAELTCQELVELVTEYLEGAMEPGELLRFDGHLERCGGCRDHLEQMRLTIRLTGQLTEASFPPDGRTALLAAFRGWKTG